MSDGRLGVALVGLGGIAVSHLDALRRSSTARLVRVCDAQEARARTVGIGEDCRWTTSLDEVLADDEVGAVMVCTPNDTHIELGGRVLESGRHLFMEKPLALSVVDARRLADLAEDRNLALGVGHTHRHTPQSLAIRAALDAGEIGHPQFVRLVINGSWIWGGWRHWVLDPAISGGHSAHNGVHLMDLATWWLGEPAVDVFSVGQAVTSPALPIPDYLCMQLRTASGSSALLEVSRAELPRGFVQFEVEITGTEGVLQRSWYAEGLAAWGPAGFSVPSPGGYATAAFLRQLDSFVAATADPSRTVPAPLDAVRAVAMAVASEESLRTGQVEPVEAVPA